MADKSAIELRREAKAREDAEVAKAHLARQTEAKKGEPKVVFTKIAGEDDPVLPEDAPASQDAKAFREVQLGIRENTPEAIVEVGLPHPETQTIKKGQLTDESVTELVYTDDVNTLPKGAAGSKVASGIYSIVKGTEAAEPDEKAEPVDPKTPEAIDVRGSHPVRLEDETHTSRF